MTIRNPVLACVKSTSRNPVGFSIQSQASPPSGSLSASSTTPTEGDNVTFSFVGTGATSYQLYKDGRYVLGATSMPYVLSNIGVQDAGNYTLVATNGNGSITTSAVTVSVTANNIVTDNFTGSVSAQWTSTTGTPDLTSNRFNCNSSSASAVYVQKTISDNNVRVVFEINVDSVSAGSVNVFELGATYPICLGQVYGGTTKYLRFQANVNGFFAGGTYNGNFNASATYLQLAISGTTKVEFRWDYNTKNWYCYVNDQYIFSVIGSLNYSSFSPAAATYFRIGKINASASGTGSYYIDSVQVKQGAVAANAFTAGSKMAGIFIGGQSNALGADLGTYSAVTDSIGSKAIFSRNDINAPATSPQNVLVTRTEVASLSPSASIIFSFIQGIDLPAGYTAYANMCGVNSTGFETNPGWGTTYPGIRNTAINALAFAAQVFESYELIAYLWHQGEADAGNDNYQTLLENLIDTLRTTGGNKPWIAGGLSPAYLTGGEAADANYQETTDDTEQLMGIVDNAAFASSVLPTSLPYLPSGINRVHFTGAGYRTFGQRYAEAYLAIVPQATP